MTSRETHMAWCKGRALEYLNAGDIKNGVTSMLSDLDKHPDTALVPGSILTILGLQAIMADDLQAARRFVEGFN